MQPRARSSSDLPLGVIAPIVIGIALVTLAMHFEGVVKGLMQGGAVALLLLGVALLSARTWRRDTPGRSQGKRLWLPSRDEDNRP